MAEPLEIIITYGEKTYVIPVVAGDTDAANSAKEQVRFILDIFAGSADAKKRPATKPAATPTAKPAGSAPPPDKPASGGAK
jgi:hypothetical protein